MTDKPLIAHVLYRLDTGGMERIAVSLINATRDRYRHAVITLTGYGAMRAEIDGSVVACLSLNKQPGKDWACHARFWRTLRKLKPDLVQSYNLGTLDLAPVAKLAGVRRVVHAEHGRDVGDPRGDNPKYQRLRRWMAPFINRIVAVSPDLKHWLVEQVGLRPDKVAYIANGIDTPAFHAPRPRTAPRRLLDEFAPSETLVFVNVARLDQVKDQAGLIRAFQVLRERAEPMDCRLVIVGDGPERATLQRRIEELGLMTTVRLLGTRGDVAQILSECDVFVLPSIAEGMPVTVLEAMASGLPVIATAVGGIASVVKDGATGTLVPPGNTDALAAAMGAYAADAALRQRHGEAGRARVNADFSLRAMTGGYIALYDQLLGHRTQATRPHAPTAGIARRGEP